MPERYFCRVEEAEVRPDRSDSLRHLIRKLFERRHHPRVGGREKEWLSVELVQSLREESTVYRRELSSKTEGPLPFALGFFRVRDGRLETVSDQLPANVEAKILAQVLSEFIQPGARLWFYRDGKGQGWVVRGIGELVPLSRPMKEEGGQFGPDSGEPNT